MKLSDKLCRLMILISSVLAGVGCSNDFREPNGSVLVESDSLHQPSDVPSRSGGGIAGWDSASSDRMTTIGEFRGEVGADGRLQITVVKPSEAADAGLRRYAQGLCSLNIVQDGVPASGPADSIEMVTIFEGLDAECEGFAGTPLYCGVVTVRSFYGAPQNDVFAQILTLAPATAVSVANGDVVPGGSSGLGSWSYGDLGGLASAPANAATHSWVFARTGINFTFTGRIVATVAEVCDGVDNDCDGLVDEGQGCRTQGQSCTEVADCTSGLACTSGLCSVTSCAAGFHVESGSCAADTRSCAIANGTGSQTYATGSWGSCSLVTCNSSYHANGNACDANVIPCSASNATAATQTWSAGAYGSCIVTACASTYHLESGACVSDSRSCLTLPANATAGTESWTGSGYGSCTATACDSGYVVTAGACVGSPTSLLPLGAPCSLSASCDSGFCATGPVGTANDRCAPLGMNYIPAGTFTMGSPTSEVGRLGGETEHSVTLTRPYFMAQTETTQGAWKAMSGGMNRAMYQNTTCTYGSCLANENANDSGPVEQADWYSAVAFANALSVAEGVTACYTLVGCNDMANGWTDSAHDGCTSAIFAGLDCLGYRLPSEAEWERAARAGTTTATYGGNLSAASGCATLSGAGSIPAGTGVAAIMWNDCSAGNRPRAVAGKLPNDYGLYDMLGNVFEWTQDWSAAYPGTVTDPLGPASGSNRVFRGGTYDYDLRYARAAFRWEVYPGYRTPQIGFRLARTVP